MRSLLVGFGCFHASVAVALLSRKCDYAMNGIWLSESGLLVPLGGWTCGPIMVRAERRFRVKDCSISVLS